MPDTLGGVVTLGMGDSCIIADSKNTSFGFNGKDYREVVAVARGLIVAAKPLASGQGQLAMRLRTVWHALVRVGFVTVLVQAASGQAPITFTSLEHFRLFNACRPVTPTIVLVASLDQDEEDRLRALVERRLRIARLYDEEWTLGGGRLMVSYATDGYEPDASDPTNIGKLRPRATARVNYHKQVTDEFGNSHIGTTWESAKTFLLPPLFAIGDIEREIENGGKQAVSDLLDAFIDEYMRANSGACGGPAGAQP